jgi:hypothetical protein
MDLIISLLVCAAGIVILMVFFGLMLGAGMFAGELLSRIMGYSPSNVDRDR